MIVCSKKVRTILGIGVVLLFSLFVNKQAFASTYTIEEKKALGYGILNCYISATMPNSTESTVKREIPLSDYSSFTSVIRTNKAEQNVPLPAYIYNGKISCQDLIGYGSGNFNGLLGTSGHVNSYDEAANELTKLGYIGAGDNHSSGVCMNFKYYRTANPNGGARTYYNTDFICSINGEFNSDNIIVGGISRGAIDIAAVRDGVKIIVDAFGYHSEKIYKYDDYDFLVGDGNRIMKTDAVNDLFDSFGVGRTMVGGEGGVSVSVSYGCHVELDSAAVCMDTNYDVVNVISFGESIFNTYRKDQTSAFRASNNLLGMDIQSISGLSFSKIERYNLHRKTLGQFYQARCYVPSDENQVTTLENMGGIRTRDVQDGQLVTCYMVAGANRNTSVYTVGGLHEYFDGTQRSFEELVSDIDDLLDGDIDPSDYQSLVNGDGGSLAVETNETDEGASSYDENACYEGSGSVGWWLCPVVEAATNIGKSKWTWIKNDFLEIKTVDFFQNHDNGVFPAWQEILGIANVAFIILFLIVIFSQLTGIGIDNYGIKKILPRLIIIAILVNLSYIICELAVDISNILGVGLNNLISGFAASEVSIPGAASNVSTAFAGIAEAFLGVNGALLFSYLGSGSLAGAGAAIGFTVLGIVLIIVASILVVYLVLIARTAGIVLCVVLAPIAIVLYALPNTEKIAKKWFDLFKALLLVFPICGLMIGTGTLAGAVLASVGNNGGNQNMIVAAMIVQVLPFVLVPTVLKNSLTLMGNAGAKISSFSRNLAKRGSSRFQSAVQGTDRYKNWDQYHRDANSALMARARRSSYNKAYGENGFLTKAADKAGERFGEDSKIAKFSRKVSQMSGRQLHNLEKDNSTIANWEGRKKRAELGSSALAYEANLRHQDTALSNEREKMFRENFERETDRSVVESEFKNSLAGNDAEMTSAALEALIDKGGVNEAFDALTGADWNKMNSNVRARLIQKMASTNIDAFKSFAKYKNTGGAGDFYQWRTGTFGGQEKDGVKDTSWGDHLKELGSNALVGYSKDEMQQVLKSGASLADDFKRTSEVGDVASTLGGDAFGSMLGAAAVKSNNAKAQTIVEDAIGQNSMTPQQLGITASMLGSMRAETAEAIRKGYEAKAIRDKKEHAEQYAIEQLRKDYGEIINEVNNDSMIRNQVNNTVKTIFGIQAPVVSQAAGGGQQAANTGNGGQAAENKPFYTRGEDVRGVPNNPHIDDPTALPPE